MSIYRPGKYLSKCKGPVQQSIICTFESETRLASGSERLERWANRPEVSMPIRLCCLRGPSYLPSYIFWQKKIYHLTYDLSLKRMGHMVRRPAGQPNRRSQGTSQQSSRRSQQRAQQDAQKWEAAKVAWSRGGTPHAHAWCFAFLPFFSNFLIILFLLL